MEAFPAFDKKDDGNVSGHDVTSSSDDHFSDASEGRKSQDPRSGGTSPIPITRVERVDDEPRHGEVPGTDAYNMRTSDAVPDEIEIVPDGQRSRSASRVVAEDRPLTPGGTVIPPTLVVEKVDPETPSHGEVPGTAAYEIRKADAEPDVVLKAPAAPAQPLPEQTELDADDEASPTEVKGEVNREIEEYDENEDGTHDIEDANDDFGDDFDEFEEGEEAGDDDFGDFDEGFQQEAEEPEPQQQQPSLPPKTSVPPPPDYDNLSTTDDIIEVTEPYISSLFPSLSSQPDFPSKTKDTTSVFLSERSLSLWTQLVQPPPLQPPNWVRSRVRRLFLVSLGVPVDLDEILPASKQKKLVLPSIHVHANSSSPGAGGGGGDGGGGGADDATPRASTDERGAVSRLKAGSGPGNASTTSIDSTASRSKRRGKGGASTASGLTPPDFDVTSTVMLCGTTEVALRGFTNEELKAHVARLEALVKSGEAALEFWKGRKESAIGDKEAFEGVIENLVKHAKKVRK